MKESLPQQNRSLHEAKVNRDDVEKYKAAFLIRQRIINEKIIDWYGKVNSGTVVFDACAGPEGSYLATVRRGGRWFGNEISIKTASHLGETGANAIVGTADHLPLRAESVDVVLYVFALNNIENTEAALKEAKKSLRPNGEIIISDPGQTTWATDIYLHEVLERNLLSEKVKAVLKKSERINSQIPAYFKEYPERKNTEDISRSLVGLYDIDLGEVANLANSIATDSIRDFRREFHEILEGLYWTNIFNVSQKLGLKIKKMGILSAAQRNGEDGWEISEVLELPIPANSKDLAEVVVSIRNNSHELSSKVIQAGSKLSKNILSPVVVLG